MERYYNKHYIRTDEAGRIVYGFSDAFLEPLEGDILINEEGGRQFEMLGEINPSLKTSQGIYLYKYLEGEILRRTDEETEADKESLPTPPPSALTLLEQAVTDLEIRDIEKDIAITDLEIEIYDLQQKLEG